jgi:hypothetical protein
MSCTPKTKKALPTQSLSEVSNEDKVIITIDVAGSDRTIDKRKEEASKPLFLKRV